MLIEQCVVDNRVFLLGLDKIYRDRIKQHERGELLRCARRVANALNTTAADVPVEGYYAEDGQLTEYFRLVRALQDIDEGATPWVDRLPEFQRLRDVASAPLFGRPESRGKLLPTGRDALSLALEDTFPAWNVAGLTAAAYETARKTDDISLVGLAARIRDAVVVAAARESVVLYASVAIGGRPDPLPVPQYVWKVDEDLAQHAKRFIDTFNTLFAEELPPPEPASAEFYWYGYELNEIVGRCVRLGYDDRALPIAHYHWAICRDAYEECVVQEFWKPEVWTTTRYRSTLRRGRCSELE